jgi:gamma-glutamyltranspeptidase/glutathione hydrolase
MLETGPNATHYAANGMVCSIDHTASSAGLAMLRAGGSAADAAIATSAMLAVTTPHLCGMGGDLFALVHDGTGLPTALNASGRAGGGADAARLRDEGATVMPFRHDVRSVPVPGCVDGWLALHERYGRLDLVRVLEPARRAAEDGFAVSALLSAMLPLVRAVAGTDDFFAPGAREPGDRCRRPGVARALAAVASDGRCGFYEGEFGAGLLDMGAGEYEPSDLEHALADWVDPIRVTAFDHEIWTIPPNSQGYLTLTGAWIADRLDLPTDPDDERWPHLLVEAARQAGHDRDAVLSETADAAALLAPDRLAPRLAAVDPAHAVTLPQPARGGDTVHLCAADADGMGVSLIQSNAADFGAHLVELNTGIFLHNRGIGFSLIPDHPAEYAPGRRPPSTLSPALVTRPDGSWRAVLGTMGGDSQPQVLSQLLARLLHAGERPGRAITGARWVLANHGSAIGFSTWRDLGSLGVDVEGHAPSSWVVGLERRGHTVRSRPPLDHGFGHAHVIENDDGTYAGMADPRAGSGAASGY